MKFKPEELKMLRKSKGYSLGTTARILRIRYGKRVTRSAICHWERGKIRPSIESLMALADLYKVDMNRFFKDFDQDNETTQTHN